jgi:rhodanese-related sulfurtransferase/peroxiredoxin
MLLPPILSRLVSWPPPTVGELAPPLSLTADDGTWVRLPDFRSRLNVLLVFVNDRNDPEAIRAIRALDRASGRFEALDVAIYGVSTSRPDTLRAWRQTHDLQTWFLYDPLAAASRGFRASSRVRPVCKDTTVLIGKDGTILHGSRGFADVEALLTLVAAREGKPVPPSASVPETAVSVVDIDPVQAERLLAAEPGAYVVVDVRTRAEFDGGHIVGALHIPVDEIPHRHAEIGRTSGLLFVCAAGGRSAQAAEFMVSIGATRVFNVAGGMSQWTGPTSSEVVRA